MKQLLIIISIFILISLSGCLAEVNSTNTPQIEQNQENINILNSQNFDEIIITHENEIYKKINNPTFNEKIKISKENKHKLKVIGIKGETKKVIGEIN